MQAKELLDYCNANFSYSPITGLLTYKDKPCPKVNIGQEVGCLHLKSGYRRVSIWRKSYMVHRIIYLMAYGRFPQDNIDHINGVRDDNRLVNIRDVSTAVNCKNLKTYNNNTSNTTGVHWAKEYNKWVARINTGKGKRVSLGYYKCKNEAIKARKDAELLYGYHSNHGNR